MAKMIQIRHVSDQVHRELRARAARAGLSLSDYLRAELDRIVARPPMEDVLARAARRRTTVTTEEITAAVRADRESH